MVRIAVVVVAVVVVTVVVVTSAVAEKAAVETVAAITKVVIMATAAVKVHHRQDRLQIMEAVSAKSSTTRRPRR